MKEITYASVRQISEAIRKKEISSKKVVEACLDRIEAVNPKLNAVVQLRAEEALQEAERADSELLRGEPRGPLHGVPMTIKDSLDTADLITAWGTIGRKDFMPNEDATVVRRLKNAGAILLGKTNTPELTLSYSTDNSVYGRTNNPYDLERTPGGSSGGSAAIVASGGSPFDIGSDTGGSIRLPAHFCGISGIRPTAGRVPRTGHAFPAGGAADRMTTIGPLARNVADLAYILPVIAGPDSSDPYIAPVPLYDPAKVDLTQLRVGYYTDNGICSPTPDIVQTISRITDILADRGTVVDEVAPPGIGDSLDIFSDLFFTWTFPWAKLALQKHGTPLSESTILEMQDIEDPSVEDCLRSVQRWNVFQKRMHSFIADYDILISPVTAYAAYPHNKYDDADSCFGYTNTYSLTGWPVVVVRVGTSSEGFPIGAQIAAKPWREDVALAVAAYLESTLGGWQAPPI